MIRKIKHLLIGFVAILAVLILFDLLSAFLAMGLGLEDTHQILILKILILYSPMSIAFLILTIQFIIGKRKVIEGERTLYDLFMVLFFLFTGIVMAHSVLADTILQDYETETITVKEIRTPRLRGLIEKEVYSIDGQVYSSPFNEFTITRGKTYEITYLARTEIIIDAEEVEGQSKGGSP